MTMRQGIAVLMPGIVPNRCVGELFAERHNSVGIDGFTGVLTRERDALQGQMIAI